MEYVTVCPAQRVVLPVIAPGVAGSVWIGVTPKIEDVPVPQLFDAVTEMLPRLVPAVTVMEVVPWPEVIVQPVGTVQR